MFNKEVFLSLNDLDLNETLTTAYNTLVEKLEGYERNGSGLIIKNLQHYYLGMVSLRFFLSYFRIVRKVQNKTKQNKKQQQKSN